MESKGSSSGLPNYAAKYCINTLDNALDHEAAINAFSEKFDGKLKLLA